MQIIKPILATLVIIELLLVIDISAYTYPLGVQIYTGKEIT